MKNKNLDKNAREVKWSTSTVKIFCENTNENKIVELLYNKAYLQNLLEDLIFDHDTMVVDFGDTDKDVKNYFVAIQDIKNWINAL